MQANDLKNKISCVPCKFSCFHFVFSKHFGCWKIYSFWIKGLFLLFSGQALLHASKIQPANQGHTNDLIQNAANMGIKMETASQFLRTSTKLLSKLKADKKTDNEDAMLDMSPLSWDSKEKESNYIIKVEDHERLHRPLFKQFDDAPKVAYNETGSPFDVGVVLVKQSDNNQSTKKKSVGGALRGGYCESCDHWYRCSLREHLSSNKHKEFVGKLDNFKNLEKVSNDLPSFNDFLKHNKGKQLSNSSQNIDSFCSNDPNNNKIDGQGEAIKDQTLDRPDSDCESKTQFVAKSKMVDNLVKQTDITENPSKFLINRYKLDCVNSEVNSFTETMNSARTSDEGNQKQNCIDTKFECHSSSNSSTTPLVTNMTRDSIGLENDDCESNRETCSEVKRLKHQSQSNKTDNTIICDIQEVPFEAPSDCRAGLSEANFSSSSCSFGDIGVRNALSILQTNISDNSYSSHGRHSADIFRKNVNGTDHNQGNTLGNVIEKSEISLQSGISGNDKNALHTPAFDKFLKGKNDEVKDTEDMPVLFQVEELSETDIGIGLTHMPVIDKHTPPSHNQKQSIDALGPTALENINDTTQGELIIRNGPFYEPCNFSEVSLRSHSESNKTEVMNFETVLHTPKSKLGNKLKEEINDKVQNSGSTITSVRNWLLPEEDKDSACSAMSVAKINDTLVASEDVGITDEKELEQLTESEQKQQNLVANWIKTQEFGTSSENHSTAIAETETNIYHNLETPNKESETKDNLSSRDITTPISEMYNDQYTDLSSIPTDSYISDKEYSHMLDQFSDTKVDKTDSFKDKMDCKDVTKSSNICDDNSVSIFDVRSGNSHSSLKVIVANNQHLSKGINSTCNMNTGTSSINTAGVNTCIDLKEKLATCPTLNNTEKVLNDNCSVDSASLSKNTSTVVNNISECDKGSDKISSDSTKLNKTEKKGAKGKKNPVKPKGRNVKTIKGKSNDTVEKCNTPVSGISCASASSLHSSTPGSFNNANNHFIQQQAYSPISQSSDNFMQQQYNSVSYNTNRVQSLNRNYQQMNGNNQQFYGQNVGSQVHYNQGQSYYDTGLLPGHNFYSEERQTFCQNNFNMQSQHYGFSGLTDCNGFASQFPQQFTNSVISYPQGSYNGAQIHDNVHTNNVNISANNYVQNVQDFSQVDFLDNSGFLPNTSQDMSCMSSPGSFCPAQNLPVQNLQQTLPLHASSQSSPQLQTLPLCTPSNSSPQFSQDFSPIQSNYHVPSQVNHQYYQQCYPDNQQNSSQYPQFFPSQHSQAPQVIQEQNQNNIQEQSQSNQWYLSSPAYTNTSQNINQMQVQESARTYETISLNDIAEENCNTSQLSFSFGRLKAKVKENQNLGTVANSLNRNSAASKKGRRKTVAEAQMNKNGANDKPGCQYMNTNSYGHVASNSVVNEIPPSVQPLKPSFSMVPDHRQQTNCSNFNPGVNHENSSSSDRSYTSAKVGDTKIKIRKVGNSTGGQKTDLKDYWNVKKTGDCRLVFRATKRKADDEENIGSASFTPYLENSVEEQSYGGLHEAKRRRCLVY